MSEFIKIKNMRGTGNTLVRVSVICAVYDKKEGGAVIEADVAGQPMKINTASTAAEVLAAIEESEKPEPSEYRLSDGLRSFYNASSAQTITKQYPAQFSVAGSMPMAESAKGVGGGLCICKEIAGDNRECPIHHLPSRAPTLPQCTCSSSTMFNHDPDCTWHRG
jgi:hypothetical protein